MIELIDTFPDVNVVEAEYSRLLGFPRNRPLEGRSRELADDARAWYARHGRPWVYAREAQNIAAHSGFIHIDGRTFASQRLEQTLTQAQACGVVLVAVTAGREVETESQRRWAEGKPDEYFFLEIFASAVVEHLITTTGARLCAWGERQGLAVLPHYSPGYPQWDIAQQPRLMELIRDTRAGRPLPGEIEVLESGMPRPRKSQLAVFGLTRQLDRVKRLTDLVPCENCSFVPCQYRRAPYRQAAEALRPSEVAAAAPSPPPAAPLPPSADPVPAPQTLPLDLNAGYNTNAKALARWAEQLLALRFEDDGSVYAHFRYEGTTCSNTGRALHFEYRVTLGPREQGYQILEEDCSPAPGHDGYRFMCRYMTNPEHLMVAIDRDKPLLGRPLNDVLAWERPLIAPACYCEPSSRKHKWGIVLETIHYALARRERERAVAAERELIHQEVQ